MTHDGEPDYILGSDDAELRRLATQHRLWADHANAVWDRAGFGPGQTILDLGCGPGYATVDLARRVGPGGRIVAVDGSRKFLDHLEAQIAASGLDRIEVRQADVHEVELEPASLDGAYLRWLLCYLRDPRAVIRKLARALAPGGVLATTDYFDYRAFTLAPRSEVMDRVVAAVSRSFERGGSTLEVQGTTPGHMVEAGLELRYVGSKFDVARPGEPMWSWPRSFFRNFLPKLVALGEVDEDDARAFERVWDERERDPGAFLCPPPMFDVIGVKPAG